MKSVLLSKNTFWSLEFYVQYKNAKRQPFFSKVTISCFYSSLFDDSPSQIPGQREPQELHFGQLSIFILKWQMHSNKEHNGLTVTLHQTLVSQLKYTL